MSIKLRFEKGSLITQVTLKDEALSELLKIIGEHQSDEVAPSRQDQANEGKMEPMGDTVPDLNDPNKEATRINQVRGMMSGHSAAELMSKIGWETFPEKILILGGLFEAQGNLEGWKSSDIEGLFVSARAQSPGNFARDISKAISSGIIATVTPRTYKVSRTGWLKLYEAMIKRSVEEIANRQ